MAREIELKLDVEPADAHRLAKLLGPPSASRHQRAVYFEGPEEELSRGGFLLRIRQEEGGFTQTVKRQASGAAGLFDRGEWDASVSGFELDRAALAQTPLGALPLPALDPAAATEVDRQLWTLEREGAAIEVSLDIGSIEADARSAAIGEIEIELKSGEPRALFGLAREVAAAMPVRIGIAPKAERALRFASGARDKASKAEPVQLSVAMSAAEALAAIAHNCLRQYRLNEPLVIEERDPTALHQARVAMRRLRSAFSLFRPIVVDPEFERLREELRWFTGELGDARNLDVLLKRFEQQCGGEPEELGSALRSARESAYERVSAAMDSGRQRRLMLGLVEWVEIGAWRRGEEAQQPILVFGERQLRRRWRKVNAGGESIRTLPEESLHRLRIEIKKLRYAVEFLSALLPGGKRKRFLDALEAMQEELGHINDSATARELVARLMPNAPTEWSDCLVGGDSAQDASLDEAARAYRFLGELAGFWKQSPTEDPLRSGANG